MEATAAGADPPVRLPKYKKLAKGLFRSYRPGDALARPTGAYTTQVQIGWRTRPSDGKRVPNVERFTADTKTALRRLVDDARTRAREGYTGRSAVSLTDYLRGWLCDRYALVDMPPEDWTPARFRTMARECVDPRHLKTAVSRNGTIERHILPAIGAYRLDELRPEHVQQVITALKAQGKHRTALLVWEILSAALHDARAAKAIGWSPVDGVPRPAYDPGTTVGEPLTPEEMRTLLQTSQAAGDRLTALWALAAATGCRPGELLGLDRSGVHVDDSDAAYVVITRRLVETHDRTPRFAPATKTGTPAVISIDAYTARLLKAHLRQQAEERRQFGDRYTDFGPVFAYAGGTPLLHRNVARAFARALDRAQLRHVRFYDQRHFHATTVMEQTGNLKLVQARLRHTSLRVLEKTYAHVRKPVDAAVARSVGEAIWGVPPGGPEPGPEPGPEGDPQGGLPRSAAGQRPGSPGGKP
jgi:integrase